MAFGAITFDYTEQQHYTDSAHAAHTGEFMSAQESAQVQAAPAKQPAATPPEQRLSENILPYQPVPREDYADVQAVIAPSNMPPRRLPQKNIDDMINKLMRLLAASDKRINVVGKLIELNTDLRLRLVRAAITQIEKAHWVNCYRTPGEHIGTARLMLTQVGRNAIKAIAGAKA